MNDSKSISKTNDAVKEDGNYATHVNSVTEKDVKQVSLSVDEKDLLMLEMLNSSLAKGRTSCMRKYASAKQACCEYIWNDLLLHLNRESTTLVMYSHRIEGGELRLGNACTPADASKHVGVHISRADFDESVAFALEKIAKLLPCCRVDLEIAPGNEFSLDATFGWWWRVIIDPMPGYKA
jgi:predicted DNA-binding protein (UPF0251 family)